MSIDIHEKFLGSMIGCALGDAIGELAFEKKDREALCNAVDQVPCLKYTDDTIMAIALAESLVNNGKINQTFLGDNFKKYYKKEPNRGYGAGPKEIFAKVEQDGTDYTTAASALYSGKGSYGNGAAMRIAPLAIFFYQSESLYEHVKESATVTHTHLVGIDGAAVMAKAIAIAISLNFQRPFSPQAMIKDLISFCRTTQIAAKLAMIPGLLEDNATNEEVVDQLGTGAVVTESMPFAIYSFLKSPHTFIETMMVAVLNGGDRDTIGAMAGALSGAYLGGAAIPSKWFNKLENSQYIETLGRELAARCGHNEELLN